MIRLHLRFGAAIAIALVLSGGLLGAQNEEDSRTDYLARSVHARIIVSEPERAASLLIGWVERRGGYFTNRSLEGISVRIPSPVVSAARDAVEGAALEVAAYEPSSVDLRDRVLRLEAGIAARRESLERIGAFLDTADVRATLAFEQELSALARELDELEGQLRYAEHRIDYASLTVRFAGVNDPVQTPRDSSFEWLNTLGLNQMIEEAKR